VDIIELVSVSAANTVGSVTQKSFDRVANMQVFEAADEHGGGQVRLAR
jgi:hypothetical protein